MSILLGTDTERRVKEPKAGEEVAQFDPAEGEETLAGRKKQAKPLSAVKVEGRRSSAPFPQVTDTPRGLDTHWPIVQGLFIMILTVP